MTTIPSIITRSTCRLCNSQNLVNLFSLGEQYVNDFVEPGQELSGIKCPLELILCEDCTLVQLRHTVPPEILYAKGYWYVSGTTQTMRDALKDITRAIESRINLGSGDVVLDIGCFPEADVVTEGYVPVDISSVSVGDKVLTRSGKFCSVKKKFSKSYHGDLVVLRLRGVGGKPLRLTPNHPVLLVRGPDQAMGRQEFIDYLGDQQQLWIRADAIKAGDYCVMPAQHQNHQTMSKLDLASLVSCDRDDDYIFAWQTHQYGPIRRAHNQFAVRRWIDLDERFGRLLGYYVAEGSGDGATGAFSFAFSALETDYVADVQSLLRGLFGLKSTVRTGTGRSVSVRCSSTLGKQVFQSLVGSGAGNKHLPKWVFSAPLEFRCGLVDGLIRGDGSVTSGYVKFDTISKTLAFQMRQLMLDIGIRASITPNRPNGYGKLNGKTLWSVRIFSKQSLRILASVAPETCPWEDDGLLGNNKWPTHGDTTLVRVLDSTRQPFNGKVYNIETSTGTYVVDTLVVHNSNDGTLLRSYSKECAKVGFEPASNLYEEGRQGLDVFNGALWSADAYYESLGRTIGYRPSWATTAIGMLYDLEDPNLFVADVAKTLHPQGLFVAQLMCLRNMLAMNDVGNFAHEHLEYYSLKSLQYLFDKHDLVVEDIETNSVNGQSYRFYVRHKGFCQESTLFQKLIGEEEWMKLHRPEFYNSFFQRLEENKRRCVSFIREQVNRGKRCWLIGASTKGNVILQYYGLDKSLIQGASERSASKHGKVTIGTGIPIYSEEEARAANPDYFLLIPYTFREEILLREEAWRRCGGRFIIPLPNFEVV